LREIDDLNVVAIKVKAGPARASLRGRRVSRMGCFEHDGQITKREIRAITLSSLAPRRGELLWDIGAGSGSVAIEWMWPPLPARHCDRAASRSRGENPAHAAAFGVRPEVVEAKPRGAWDVSPNRRNLHRAAAPTTRLTAVRSMLRVGAGWS